MALVDRAENEGLLFPRVDDWLHLWHVPVRGQHVDVYSSLWIPNPRADGAVNYAKLKPLRRKEGSLCAFRPVENDWQRMVAAGDHYRVNSGIETKQWSATHLWAPYRCSRVMISFEDKFSLCPEVEAALFGVLETSFVVDAGAAD